MADDDKTRKPDDSKGRKPAERILAGSEIEDFEDDVTPDEEDGSLTKMEMELAQADAEEPAGDDDKEPKPPPRVEQPVPLKPLVAGVDAAQLPKDATAKKNTQ